MQMVNISPLYSFCGTRVSGRKTQLDPEWLGLAGSDPVRGCVTVGIRGGRHVGGVRLFVQPKRDVVSAPTSLALIVRRSAQPGEAIRGLFRP